MLSAYDDHLGPTAPAQREEGAGGWRRGRGTSGPRSAPPGITGRPGLVLLAVTALPAPSRDASGGVAASGRASGEEPGVVVTGEAPVSGRGNDSLPPARRGVTVPLPLQRAVRARQIPADGDHPGS